MFREALPSQASVLVREAEVLKSTIQRLEDIQARKLGEIEELREQQRDLRERSQQLEQEHQRLKEDVPQAERQLADLDLLYTPEYEARRQHYQHSLNAPMTQETRQILNWIRRNSYIGIVVYPEAVKWEPQQRPQHLLKQLAASGYLCIFCEAGDSFSWQEAAPGLAVLTAGMEPLLRALQSFHVLVINSWLLQNAWIDLLPHKTIWYDVLDRLDFFSFYDRGMLAKHYEVLHEAALVTYSAKKLQEYVQEREDALYLPNGVTPQDFANRLTSVDIPQAMVEIVNSDRKILGYYGAIEEWIDVRLIEKLAKQPNVEIVLIGHCGISTTRFPNNVHLIDAVPYAELPTYAACFDALFIPFQVNELTNSVSPVKFFEYCAIGKPILSSPIAELIPFEGPGVTLLDPDSFDGLPEDFWEPNDEALERLAALAQVHTWSARATSALEALEHKAEWLNVLANRKAEDGVNVFTSTFLDYNGENYYSGGAERYLLDLYEVCSEMGLRLDIYQYGHYAWYRKYRNIDVYSLGHEELDLREFSVENLKMFNRKFLYASEGRALLHIYSAFFQAYPEAAHPSIGISHGVAWDHPGCEFESGEAFWNSNERFIRGAKQVETIVSVDTNTPNWFQTISHQLGRNMLTIPNYVNTKEFYPVKRSDDGKIRILYPRRLYEARGLYLTLAVLDPILERYPEVEFHFVGKGFPMDLEQIDQAIERWPGRVYRYDRDPNDMHEVYKQADIVLIPTLYSEGTSLSCLEACATGNTVIATRVGGLTDLIIDRFNGLLITPSVEELERALMECLDDEPFRLKLSQHAVEVAQAFDKSTWKSHWKTVIRQTLGMERDYGPNKSPQPPMQTVEIRLGSRHGTEWIPCAVEALKRGDAVFVRGGDERLRESGFGRMQWISAETEWYGEPDRIEEFG